MGIGRACGFGSTGGNLFRGGLLLATAILVCASGFASAARADNSATISTEEWRSLLLDHTDDFASARLDYRKAGRALSTGDPVRARQLLKQAAEQDPRFYQPHRKLAWLDVRAGRSTVIGEMLEATSDRWSGYRNQALALANGVIWLNLVLGVFLVWTTALFLVRYLPYLHHRVAQAVLVENHRARFARWLWPAVLAPFAIALSWGLLPWLALSIVVVWVHADRRPRSVLATALLILIVQGVWPRPVATILTGTDMSSRAALVERAAYEPPSTALLREIDVALTRSEDDPDLLSARGLLLARRGAFEPSATTLRRALELRPNDPIATGNLAAVHFFRGDVDRAVAGFQRAVSLDSTRAVSFYNLSQAYLQKLYLKEGGQALQSALSRDFSLASQVERLPRGAVYFLRPDLLDSWRIAWSTNATVKSFDLLEPWRRWVGVPSAHVTNWLVGTLGLALALGLVFPRRKLVFECANCGSLTCRHCRGEHEGAVLCTHCHSIARRAKSEVVLTTMLRNRRRESDTRYQERLRGFDRTFPGSGRLIDGAHRKGVFTGLLVSLALVWIVLGDAPLRDAWDIGANGFFTAARVSGFVLLGLLYFGFNAVRIPSRNRHLQPHPSSSVSLAGLIETRRAGAGG
jgi:tetratricopeptide (TPR) repeat protein